jgi:uncharacterized protein (TIGR02466 family)
MGTPEIRVSHLFSAPLLQFVWKDSDVLNEELRRLILDKRDTHPGERMSNAGGWQSPKDLQNWEAACIRELVTRIDVAVYMISKQCVGEEAAKSLPRWHVAAWANVNERGDYNMIHNHAGGVWSGVYYVDPGAYDPEHPTSGVISFRSPTMAALATNNLRVPESVRRLFPADHPVRPQYGLMLIFPSWLDHQVYPYRGDRPRISVSWDAIFPSE